jgi:Zn-dependent protease with chaperone function
MAAYGLYTHIQSNKRRSIALLIGLFFLVYLLVYAGALVGEALTIDAPPDVLLRRALSDALYAAPWATLGTALWILIAYKFHQSMIDAVTGGREVTRQEEPRLYNLLENLCISRGITTPKLKVIEDDSLNAFATGMNDKQYSITVTSGLINALNDAEIESVLGHELTHIRNGDVRMLVIAVIIAGVIAFFAELVFRLLFQGGFRWRGGRDSGDRKGAGVAILIALVLIADQEPGCYDLGAAQDRGPRRASGRDLGGHGNVHRQSARGIFQHLRHPSAGRCARGGAGQIRRRPRPGPAGAARAGRSGRGRERGCRSGRSRRAVGRIAISGRQRRAVSAEPVAGRTRLLAVNRQRARPVGTAPEIADALEPFQQSAITLWSVRPISDFRKARPETAGVERRRRGAAGPFQSGPAAKASQGCYDDAFVLVVLLPGTCLTTTFLPLSWR